MYLQLLNLLRVPVIKPASAAVTDDAPLVPADVAGA
jgi:hypothetical protein